MAAGAHIIIRDPIDRSTITGSARVTNHRLWVDALVGGGVALVVQVTEGDVTPPTPELVPTAAQRRDVAATIAEADGQWTHLLVDNIGALWVRDETRVTESTVVPGGPLLIPIAAERDDALTTLPELDGEWVHLRTDSVGALWVRDTQVLPICDHTTPENCPDEVLMVGGCGDILNGGNGSACCVLQLDENCYLKVVEQQTVVEGAAVIGSPDLFPIAAERDDALTTLPEADGDWVHLRTSSIGGLWVQQAPGSIIALSVSNFEGSVAPVAASSATGIPALSVRDDDLTQRPAHVVDGDYIQLHSDSRGALWVRDFVPTDHLSGSTNGQPIRIVAVATPGTTLHTAVATAGEIDKIWIWISNTGTVQVTVTIEFGAVGVGNEMDFKVPANDTILAVAGWALGGAAGQVVRAFASAANVLQATGHFERMLNP